jgi:hypothetical protein
MESWNRDYPDGAFRASDAERDRALAELTEAFEAGRLTQEEFDDRSGQALAARTGNELAALLADLPPGESTPPPSSPSPRRSAVSAAALVVTGAAIVAVVVIASQADHHDLFGSLPIPVVALVVLVRLLSRWRGDPGRRTGPGERGPDRRPGGHGRLVP